MTRHKTETQPPSLQGGEDCEQCYVSKAQRIIIDVIRDDGLTFFQGKTFEQVRRENPDAEKMSVDAFCQWLAEQQRTPIEWQETTKEKFMYMLEVLPPAAGASFGYQAFLVGEPWDHDALNGRPRYQAYRKWGESYQVSNRPITVTEFMQEVG